MNWKILIIFLFTTLGLLGDIGGVVYQDIPLNGNQKNTYGVKETNELGVAGVTVSILTDSGLSSSTITGSDGAWNFTTTDKNFRVEFSNWSNYLLESPKGTNGKNSSIRFVKNGNMNISFGLYDMNRYFTTANPSYVTTITLNGSNKNSSIPTLITNKYRDSKVNKNTVDGLGNPGTGNPFQVNAVASQTGTIWGLGYQALKKRMFVASSLQRHVGNINNKLDRILVVDYNNSNKITGVISLEGINGINLGDVNRTGDRNYELPDDPLAPNVDLDAFAKAGKVSFGDLDFDEKTQTIWAVNLFQRSIIRMDGSLDDINRTASSAQQYLLSTLAGTPTCTGGILRPWALAIHEGKGYIGMVCDASISQNKKDLKAHLSRFDLLHPEKGLTSVFSMNLDYDRKTNADGFQGNQYYFPWTDKRQKTISFTKDFFWDYHNQPLLSDIEFDAKGNGYLAFSDRYTLQIGFRQYPATKNPKLIEEAIEGYGEILKICSVNGKFLLEGSDPACPEGKSRNGDVDFFDDKGGDFNANSVGGALAILPGTEQLLSTVNSPHPDGGYGKEYHLLNGVQTFSTKDGSIDNWYAQLLGKKPYHGKGVGLGDLEFLNESAPIELGDRIWLDGNGNGIQDVNEAGIEGIQLELYQSGTLLASIITNKDGDYLFSNDSSQSDSLNRKYNIQALEAGKTYLLRVPNITGDNKQASLGDFLIATSAKGVGNTATLHDSNVTVNGNNVDVVIVPHIGKNDHSLDIGFKPLSPIIGGVGDITSCTCSDYETNSIGTIDSKIAVLLLILFNLLVVYMMQEETFYKKKDKKD